MDAKAIGELMQQRRDEERERRSSALKSEHGPSILSDGSAYTITADDSHLDIDVQTTKAENARLSLALASFGDVPSGGADALLHDKDSDDEFDDETADEEDVISSGHKSGKSKSKKDKNKKKNVMTAAKRAAIDESVMNLEADSDDEKDATKKKDRINTLLHRAKVIPLYLYLYIHVHINSYIY
jgi:hypothetical protein